MSVLLKHTCLAILFATTVRIHAQPILQEHWWHAWSNFAIELNAIVADTSTNTLFVGHQDILWVPPVPSANGAVLDMNEGWPGLAHDTPNGIVYTCISDGSGGWFVGGAFTQIGGVQRNRLARLNANGSLNTTWDPLNQVGVQGGDVRTIELHNGKLYVGGNFTSAGGSARNRLAAFDINTATLTTWNTGFSGNNGIVRKLEYGDGFLYAGGTFTNIGGESRSRLAQLDIQTAGATAWAPIVSGDVYGIAISNNNVYIAGQFSSVNGIQRSRIASLHGTTAEVLPWNPSAINGQSVNDIVISGDTAFVGGNFTTIGGAPRNHVAALSLSSDVNNALSWSPSIEGSFNAKVNSLQITGDRVFIGGIFNGVSGLSRNCSAAVDRTSGLPIAWNPSPYDAEVWSLSLSGSSIYVGGNFSAIGTRARSGVTAFDISTGKPTTWDVDVVGFTVNALAQTGDTLFFGGDFNTVNGLPRNNLAAISKTTGELLSWEVNVQGSVNSLIHESNRLYVGGNFTSANGIPRNHFAAVNASSASVIPAWQADVTGSAAEVRKLDAVQDRLFIIGSFESIAGVARNNIAAVSLETGLLQPWLPSIPVSALSGFEAMNDRFYVKQQDFPWSIVALGSISGEVDASWNCASCGSSGAVLESGGSRLYSFGTTFPYNLVALDWSTGIPASWSPEINGTIDVMLRAGNHLFTGGAIGAVNGNVRRSLAVWEVPDDFEDFGTGIVNGTEQGDQMLYPNPNTGQFFLELTSTAQVAVFDASGRQIIAEQLLQGTRHTIDLGDAPGGVYSMRIIQDGRVEVRRFIVQH